jgi:2-keto-4-pentenoate hydratase/2-oxohepta-3-ene-1,7-dioic acid hydratase in catechol pathway
LKEATGDPFAGGLRAGTPVQGAIRWLTPSEPAALICIGLNYRQHAIECNLPLPKEPVVFMKNPSAAAAHLEPIRIPAICGDEVDYECELAVIIGRSCRDVTREQALEYVLGYVPANDVSARIWQMQRGGSQWVRGKSFDTFAPFGPLIATVDEIGAAGDLTIRTELNGEIVQNSTTADMIFDVPTLVSFLSQGTTLRSGTVILTGTPQGIGWTREPKKLLKAGDQVSIELGRIGKLTNPVLAG